MAPPKNARHMKNSTDVTRELNKIYFEARRGQITTQDCSRFANVLNIIMGALRESELESEIRLIKEALHDRGFK